ncbi:hypothetical protein SCA6_004072, partial [Theobroma cacao]
NVLLLCPNAEEKAPQTLAKTYCSNEEPVSSVVSVKEVKTVNAKAMNKMKETVSASPTITLSLPIINTGKKRFALKITKGAFSYWDAEEAEVESDLVVPSKENVCKGQISDAILPNNKQTILPTKTEEAMRSSRPSPSRLHTTIVGRNFYDAAEPENSDVAERETWNIRLKVSLYCPHRPALHTTWAVHRKAYKSSQKMPPVLQVNVLHQCHLQADILQNGCLDLCDIALYFYPVDYTERCAATSNSGLN